MPIPLRSLNEHLRRRAAFISSQVLKSIWSLNRIDILVIFGVISLKLSLLN